MPYVSNGDIPWTIRPDFGQDASTGVIERLSWLTDVLPSTSNIEQRRRLRISPRMTVSCNFTVWKQNRRTFDALLMGPNDRTFTFPLWWECYPLQSQATLDSSFLSVATANTDIQVGLHPDVARLKPVSYTSERLWCPSTSQGCSLRTGWCRPGPRERGPTSPGAHVSWTGDVSANRVTDEAYTAPVVFEITEPNDYPAILSPVLSEPFPQFDLNPGYMSDLTYGYRRFLRQSG